MNDVCTVWRLGGCGRRNCLSGTGITGKHGECCWDWQGTKSEPHIATAVWTSSGVPQSHTDEAASRVKGGRQGVRGAHILWTLPSSSTTTSNRPFIMGFPTPPPIGPFMRLVWFRCHPDSTGTYNSISFFKPYALDSIDPFKKPYFLFLSVSSEHHQEVNGEVENDGKQG